MFKGSMTALVTPFKGSKIDEDSFSRFVEWQLEQGTEGLIPCGSTGELATLSDEEHERLITLAVEVAKGKASVIAGCGTNSTEKTIKLTKVAKSQGADAALIVVPYYNKPSQDGIYQHFKAVHDAVDIPIILYNVPGRTITDMSVDTVVKLSQLKNIVGIKDATADLARPAKTSPAVADNFCQLSGDDPTTIPFMLAGGHGAISVTSNVAPKLCRAVQDAWRNEDTKELIRLNEMLMPLHEAMFCETNPCPVKYGVQLLGFGNAKPRLPLTEISDASKARVFDAMNKLGLV